MLVWHHSNDVQQSSEIAPFLLLGVLAFYLFFDGLFMYLSVIQLGLYAAFALAASSQAALSITQISIRKRELNLLLVWVLISSVYLLPALSSEYQYTRYILTDLIATLVPVALIVTGIRFPGLFQSKHMITLVSVAAFSAAILAVLAAETATRHEPPSTLLIAAVWSAYFVARSRGTRQGTGIALALLLVLAWTSGERTAVLLWLGLGLAGRFFLVMRLRNLLLVTFLLLVVTAATFVIYGESILLAAASTRFESLAQGELDISLLNRVLEVGDTWSQWSLSQWYGYGHGATYVPDMSYLARNFTEHGRVHNIHFGPMLMLYRYGLPGLLLYLWLIVDVLRFAMQLKRVGYNHADSFIYLFFVLGLTGYLASFLAFNVMPDPAFSYVLAGYLYFRLIRRAPVIYIVHGENQ